MGAYFTNFFYWDDCLGRVMVRNSVLLIDFIEIRFDGEPLKQAIIEAGAVRTSPILLRLEQYWELP
jgi:hypothetical protein